MIKQEIIEKISKYFKLTGYEAEKVYDDIFSLIIAGVRDDNIADVANFGEFIIKHDNSKSNGNDNGTSAANGQKKTVEFLPSSNLEEELNQGRTGRPFQVDEFKSTEGTVSAEHDSLQSSSVEDELRKKREEILSKITGPILPKPTVSTDEPSDKESKLPAGGEEAGEEISSAEPGTEESKADEPETKKPESVEETEEIETKHYDTEATAEAEKEKIAEDEDDDLSKKSFSDYFSEIIPGSKSMHTQKQVEEPNKEVIPKSAVLLHNEIIGSESPHKGVTEEPIKKQIQPVSERVQEAEHRADDNSYYIWYKDSESNPTDTQTLSYEYELLYQATKEAEYKSKLKIYVTSFILFFSIVLLLLIFSPVIYKVFFSPEEIRNIENFQGDSPDVSDQKGVPNVIQESTLGQQVTVPPPGETEPPEQTQVGQEQKTTQQDDQAGQKQQVVPPVKQEEEKKNQQQVQPNPLEQAGNNQQQSQTQTPGQSEVKMEGVSRNNLGWLDEKFKVIYIQLESGKFTIQESAWDSDAKANKRISTVESFGIAGLKGTVVKAELGSKGTWFRIRFGEFSTLEEARRKAEELRSKEKIKLQAMLVYLILYA